MVEKEKCKGKIETKNMRSKKMERLLFESKGAPTKAVVMSGVGGGILAVLGIVIIVISQMKHATHSVCGEYVSMVWEIPINLFMHGCRSHDFYRRIPDL